MAETLRLEILTPYGEVFSADVQEVSASGTEGDFGVLPGHAPFVTTLRIGMVVARQDGRELFFFVNRGYAEVGPQRVLILADSAERAEDIDVQRALAAKKRAEERLKRQDKIDFARAQAALERAVMRVQVAERRQPQRTPSAE
ncbi:MAG TPA: F0F1 ATP synthase subunit epsilon [Clostridiales bacterium]|jgi:F-type H+-transporting ATPase subunit epsilon|nr:F0F1 ATP synthase subunit epsilon [Clostridiales bacterium]